ncbi:hypothetical protein C9383_03640 [Pseudomonas palleroniana]|uniref:Uncharacterized protein n=1 Tax=Pseudomonas palleroniana TaxID=191390 RepID=A0A1H5NC03_9PSED|nr:MULTISPECIES: hypothetical protein [Pseudomonas]KAB0569805.1 hypothetical protein F7R03_01370 [Pseudomonas palleroniana]MBM9484836.1 hypothetical protein [Pseudomonas sp. ICBG1301]PTC31327.1 hypothetical protein C9383_03640 [Pseudomonas palleroniana]SEE98188.1 hypothetical protein SAMN04490198_4040 [Pseudomonas palleroniana]
MRHRATPPLISRSWMITLLIGLVFLAAGYGLRFEIDRVSDPGTHSSLELALLLCGYLLVFCIRPIQKTVLRKLCQRAAHREYRKTTR